MLKSIIKNERDLRRLMRTDELIGRRLRWVEPALGSTVGIPDCFLQWGQPGEPTVLWLELKVGVQSLRSPEVLSFGVRADQRSTIGGMVYEGMKCGFIIAEVASRKVYAAPASAAILGNVVTSGPKKNVMEAPVSSDGKIDWRLVFNFIFFDELSDFGRRSTGNLGSG